MRDMTDDDAASRTQISKYNYLEDQNYLFKNKLRQGSHQAVKFTPTKSNYSLSINNTG